MTRPFPAATSVRLAPVRLAPVRLAPVRRARVRLGVVGLLGLLIGAGCATTGVTPVDAPAAQAPTTVPGTLASGSTVPGSTVGGSTVPGGTTPGSTVGSTPVRSFPAVPAGGTDCGAVNLMSGWPTTFAHSARDEYRCIVEAAASGTPARYSVVHPSNVPSGRSTSDGYEIPAATIISYVVRGTARVEVITDTREQPGGSVTTQTCSAIGFPPPGSPGSTGSDVELTGCTPS